MNRNGGGYGNVYGDVRDGPYRGNDGDYHRREYEWNEYVAQGSPPRSIDMDYPRDDMVRRRGGPDHQRIRDRSPIRDYRRDDHRRDYRGSPRRDPTIQDCGGRREPRQDYRDERRRSPMGNRDRSWARGACSTVVLRNVPDCIEEYEVRDEVKQFGAPVIAVRMEFEQDPSGANERVCVVEFEGTRDASDWMHEHQGILRIDRERIHMEYWNETEFQEYDQPRREFQPRDDRRRDDDSRYNRGIPSDTMIVKGLDRNTDEQTIRKSFEYITHFPIIDIRLVRDKLGVSRGFCFVQWKTVEECKQVLEYLKGATPRFHIEGKHVMLEFSTPQGSSRRPRSGAAGQSVSSTSAISASVQVAEAAIQAAHWSRGDKEKGKAEDYNKAEQESKPNYTPASVSTQANKPATAIKDENNVNTPNTSSNLQPGEYPTPDTAKFQYDATSGYYYDATTGLYYDGNSRYFYNSFTGQYLYWDQAKRNYVPVSNEIQTKEKEKKEKEQKEQKKKTAKKIAKDMERWAKAQNKKKEEYKKLLEDTPSTTPISIPPPLPVQTTPKKESSTADTAFFLLEKRSSEAERQAAVQAAYTEDPFKKPDMPLAMSMRKPASSTSSGLVSYMKTSDSESDEENETEEEEKLIDWNKMACLLCRRGFPSKDMLLKHRDLSELHKTNLEQRRKNKTGRLVRPKNTETPKYRDRAAERRKNFGTSDAPINKKNDRFRAPVPFEQPTKDGLDETNIGNQMLQRMGWNKGSGLGRSQSGITAPITVQQRSRGAGLGMRGSSYGLDGSEGDYRTAAKKITHARYMEAE